MLYLITTSRSCPEEWERCLFNISINRSKEQIHTPNQRIKLNPRLFLSLPYQTDNRDIIVKKSRVRTLERHGNYGKIPDLDHMAISTPYRYVCSWVYAHKHCTCGFWVLLHMPASHQVQTYSPKQSRQSYTLVLYCLTTIFISQNVHLQMYRPTVMTTC